MDLSNLKPAKGSVKRGRRLGRGQGSGKEELQTRGHKGAKQRSGYAKKRIRRWTNAPSETSAEIWFHKYQSVNIKPLTLVFCRLSLKRIILKRSTGSTDLSRIYFQK